MKLDFVFLKKISFLKKDCFLYNQDTFFMKFSSLKAPDFSPSSKILSTLIRIPSVFIVKRAVGSAVKRNYARRKMKEALKAAFLQHSKILQPISQDVPLFSDIHVFVLAKKKILTTSFSFLVESYLKGIQLFLRAVSR